MKDDNAKSAGKIIRIDESETRGRPGETAGDTLAAASVDAREKVQT